MSGSSHRIAFVSTVLIASAVLLWLSIPRFAAAIATAKHDQTVRDLSSPKAYPAVPAIEAALSSRRAGLGWIMSGDYHEDKGALYMAQARAAEFRGNPGRRALEVAATEYRRAVAIQPVSPYSWLNLAQVELRRSGVTPTLAPYLEMASRTAPLDPDLSVLRARMGLVAWRALPPDLRRRIGADVHLWFGQNPVAVARFARRGYRLKPVRDALADNPARLAAFDRVYLRESR